MLPVVSRSDWLKHFHGTYARSLEEQSLWLLQKRNACYMPPIGFVQFCPSLVGAAKESAEVNRKRAPSGPVKVVVTNQPHSRRHTGVDVVSGAFRPYWRGFRLAGPAIKIAPCFLRRSSWCHPSPARGFLLLPPSSL